jgi:hypothetical protein
VNKILPYALPSCRYFVIEMENRIMHLRWFFSSFFLFLSFFFFLQYWDLNSEPHSFFFLCFSFNLLLFWGTLWHSQKFLQYQIYQTWITPSIFLFSPSPLPGVFEQISFFNLHRSVHSICTVFTLL